MIGLGRISSVYKKADVMHFDDSSRIILMSDCHRGDGTWSDNMMRNQNIVLVALRHYYNEGFVYIEIGDGDELWENKSLEDIIIAHKKIYKVMSQFHTKGRFISIIGNHDKCGKQGINGCLCEEYLDGKRNMIHLFNGLKRREGLILQHAESGGRIFLLHGHQGDLMNDYLWRLAKFLVRHLWRPLELLGIKDPTSAAKNYSVSRRTEERLSRWIGKEKIMTVCGHTHRPSFPEPGELPYFNDGSCVHPTCITSIEIFEGTIALIKWSIKAKDDGTLYVGKDYLEGPRELAKYLRQ